MDTSVYSQQRKDLRATYKENVRFSIDQFNWHLGRSRNISKKGIFIETEKMPKLGARVYLNFKIPSRVYTKNIKAVGEVVRLADTKEKFLKMGNSGIGIKFSLLPNEELVMRSFISDSGHSIPGFFPRTYGSVKPVYGSDKGALHLLCKWWLKELADKALTFKGVVVESVVLVIILMIVFIIIL